MSRYCPSSLLVLMVFSLTACTMRVHHYGTIDTKVTIVAPDGAPVDTHPWCAAIPEQYRQYIDYCNTQAPAPVAAALSRPSVSPFYGFASNWNDYVKSDGSGLCTGSETSYTSCLNGGELRLASTGETSCAGLSLADSAGAFSWACSLVSGHAAFKSTLNHNKGLQHLITGTSWIPLTVTLTRGAYSSTSASSSWWANPIVLLPDNSSTSAGAVSLSSPGTIYVTSSNIYTSGYNIGADKVSVVALAESTIYHNAATGTNAHLDGSIGNDARTVLATGGRKFLWVEGAFDMNDSSSGGSWTVFLSNTVFSRLKLLKTYRGYPLYLYQSNYNTLDGVTVSDSVDFGMELDTSNGNAVLNSTSEGNPYHYGMGMGNCGGNYVYNFKSNNSFGGIRVWSTVAANTFDQMLFTNVASGLYLVSNTVGNSFTNLSVENVTASNSGIYLDRSDNQTIHNVYISSAPHCVSFGIAHNNTLSELKLSGCDYGVYTYDGAGTSITGELWFLSDTTNCYNYWGSDPGYNTDCTAAGSSTFNLVSSSSNVFGYSL